MRAALLGLGLGVARALGQDYCPDSDDATAQAPAYLPFRTGTAWPDLATLVRSRNASRGYVELAGALRCYDLYDFGVLTRFDQALLAGDVVVDCLGPVVPDGIGERPDLARATFAASRTRFRPAFSPRRYAEERDASKAVAGRSFRVGVSLTYVRDGNFEMFYAVDVSRWWYVLQMLSAGWAPEGPVAIVLSGRDGGSGAAPHAYVREAMELLEGVHRPAGRARPRIGAGAACARSAERLEARTRSPCCTPSSRVTKILPCEPAAHSSWLRECPCAGPSGRARAAVRSVLSTSLSCGPLATYLSSIAQSARFIAA